VEREPEILADLRVKQAVFRRMEIGVIAALVIFLDAYL